MKKRMITVLAGMSVLLGTVAIIAAPEQKKQSKEDTAMELVFAAAEAEFKALTPLVALVTDEGAVSIIRSRLVFCVMLMKHCVDAEISVTRERPNDGFERRPVTQEWVQKYEDQVSKYPEWKDRISLVTGILIKVSG